VLGATYSRPDFVQPRKNLPQLVALSKVKTSELKLFERCEEYRTALESENFFFRLTEKQLQHQMQKEIMFKMMKNILK